MASKETYGWGRHGENRVHYIPRRHEIVRLSKLIREKGWRDNRGRWHPPWDEQTEQERRVGAFKNLAVPEMLPLSAVEPFYIDDFPLAAM